VYEIITCDKLSLGTDVVIAFPIFIYFVYSFTSDHRDPHKTVKKENTANSINLYLLMNSSYIKHYKL